MVLLILAWTGLSMDKEYMAQLMLGWMDAGRKHEWPEASGVDMSG